MTTREFRQKSAFRIFLSYFKPHRKLFFLDMTYAAFVRTQELRHG